MLSSRKSPARSARRATTSSSTGGGSTTSRNTSRAEDRKKLATARPSARLKGPPPTVSDVFEIVADGNAELLAEVIEFSGAEHVCELRSKNQEDYGRNLLHCAVTNGQLRTLQVLLEHNVFDPNQVRVVSGLYERPQTLAYAWFFSLRAHSTRCTHYCVRSSCCYSASTSRSCCWLSFLYGVFSTSVPSYYGV